MTACSICNGVGLVRVVNETGRWVSRSCECQQLRRENLRLAAARIPKGYWECSLDTYDTAFNGVDPSQAWALKSAQRFVDEYPVTQGVRAC